MLPESRACTKCGLDKPLSEFSKAPRGKYGVKASCKACDAARYAANPFPSRALPVEELQRKVNERRGDTKRCTVCGEVKPRSQFSKARDGKYGPILRSECKPCCSQRAMQWYRDNPGRTVANKRRFNLEKLYGISLTEYEAMRRRQGGVCAVCGKAPAGKHARDVRLVVDHCHQTGETRGLLCNSCNRAIGLLGDDPILMRKAISYLLRHQKGAVHQGGQ